MPSHHATHTPASAHAREVRLLILVLTVILAASSCLLFLSIANRTQVHAARAAVLQQQTQFAAMNAAVQATLQKRIDDARKAEAEAKTAAQINAQRANAQPTTQVPFSTTAQATACAAANPDSLQVVINKKNCFRPLDYTPADLVTVNDITLRKEAMTQTTALLAAAAVDSQPIAVTSSFRSYDTQVATYAYWVEISGVNQADTYSARPGYSEHQTGLAIDVKAGECALSCFADTSQYTWLAQHAAEYGFIQRYPADLMAITGYQAEPWHWRYVGKTVAADMKSKGIQTLEQYFRVVGGDYAP
ncbi:MAG: M15 family metallopeptidase [Candidatus Saccharimonas sp.]